MLGVPCLKYWRCVLFLKALKYMLTYRQPTNFKMLIFLFGKRREGPGEL